MQQNGIQCIALQYNDVWYYDLFAFQD